jgi:FtsP/CotA-like multicopper oxidase with cupredoxin domain
MVDLVTPDPAAQLTRRGLLAGMLGTGAVLGLSACGGNATTKSVSPSFIAAVDSTRPRSGSTRTFALTARPAQVDLGGTVVSTWAYGDTVPGKPIRVTAGDRVQVAFTNRLPMATSVHWHGLAIRNDMDGVPGVTTPETPAGGTFDFDFVVPDPGTHWFHPHHGLQMDRGLYAPFVVDDPHEKGAYDHEWIVVLDDWTDGVGPSPEDNLAALQSAGQSGGMGGMNGMDMGGMGGMDMGGMGAGNGGMGSGMGIMDGGDVTYPLFLINGRTSTDPDILAAKPGQRVRLRIINAAADTIFTVALEGHDLQVTHTDGYPVIPTSASSLRIGMGERYDATVTLADGVFPLVAQPVGKQGTARALVRTGSGPLPALSHRPAELGAYPLTVDALRVAPDAALPRRTPDTVQDLMLSGSMSPYAWTINGTTYDNTVPLTIRPGQSGRLRIRNHSMMSHPMHVHGHTFQLGHAGGTGPRKDTVLVPPMGGVDVDLVADNPGKWMVHCHNAYHAESGMMTRLDYVD